MMLLNVGLFECFIKGPVDLESVLRVNSLVFVLVSRNSFKLVSLK